MSASSLALEDLDLALQLQREDLEMLKHGRKGKAPEGETDDFNLAIQLYEADLASCAVAASDRSICGSIARAVKFDADLIGAILLEEEQATLDREFACGLSTGAIPTEPARPTSTLPIPDEELLARLEALYVSHANSEHPAESSAWAADRPLPRTREEAYRPKIECISCGDKHYRPDISRCPCSHEYCPGCLESLFTASLSDESLFPPRCCGQPISLDSCRTSLSSKLAGEFLAKKAEMETPNRTYCHLPTCSAFIPQHFIKGEVATCIRCRKTTCVTCKRPSHEGDCPHDPAVQELLRFAAENGWQRCYSCHRLVELDHGCNHMSKYFPRIVCLDYRFTVYLHVCSLSVWSSVLLPLRPALEDVRL